MDNYERALVYARGLFLKWDQEKIIARAGLEADGEYIYLHFLGLPHCIRRESGEIFRMGEERLPCGFSASLSIFDYLCREGALPIARGELYPVNSLKHVAQSSPSDISFHQSHADRMMEHLPALREAVKRLGISPFPQGDAACVFPVFNGFSAIFQFWEGDEEFPPSVRFLWRENAQEFLKYETIYYVMGCILERIWEVIAEIEKNVK